MEAPRQRRLGRTAVAVSATASLLAVIAALVVSAGPPGSAPVAEEERERAENSAPGSPPAGVD